MHLCQLYMQLVWFCVRFDIGFLFWYNHPSCLDRSAWGPKPGPSGTPFLGNGLGLTITYELVQVRVMH